MLCNIMPRDFYETLGVSKTATDEEIKSAFRRKAREHHPDVATDKATAEAKFKEVNEAYQVLSDKQKRGAYDRFGHAGVNGHAGGQSSGPGGAGFDPFGGGAGGFRWSYSTGQGGNNQGFEDIDPFEVFSEIFGGGFGRRRKGRDQKYMLEVSFEDAIKGLETDVKIGNEKLHVKIPAGAKDGTQIKYVGKGENPGKGVPPGDLYIVLNVKANKDFNIQGLDVYSTVDINMAIAALGGSIEVKVVDPGSNTGYEIVKMKIPNGTQPETRFRIKGKGMPSINNKNTRGDHYVIVKISIPTKLNWEQKKALEELF